MLAQEVADKHTLNSIYHVLEKLSDVAAFKVWKGDISGENGH